MKKKNTEISARAVATIFNVTIETIRNWERIGKLPPYRRTEGGRRIYLESEVLAYKADRDKELKEVRQASVAKARAIYQASRQTAVSERLRTELDCLKGIAENLRGSLVEIEAACSRLSKGGE